MEKEYHADTKIATIEESTVKQDSEIVEEKLEDVVSGEDSKDLRGLGFVGVEEISVTPICTIDKSTSSFILEFENFAFEGIHKILKELGFLLVLQDAPKLEWKPFPTHFRYHIPFSEKVSNFSTSFVFSIKLIFWMPFKLCNFHDDIHKLGIDLIVLMYPP